MIYKVTFKDHAVKHHNMTRNVYVKEKDIDYVESREENSDKYIQIYLKRDIRIVYKGARFESTNRLSHIDSIESI